jgi:lysozyme
MKLSEQGLQMLTILEGSRPNLYLDSVGLPTIGVGHLLSTGERVSGFISISGRLVNYRRGLSDQQVIDLLEEDVSEFEDSLNSFLRLHNICLAQHQFDAIIMWMFNVGIGAANKSTLYVRLSQKELSAIPKELAKWVRAGGRRLAGLINRRNYEIDLFTKSIYIGK